MAELNRNNAHKNAVINFRTQGEELSDLPPRERILIATYETILEDQISGTRLRKIAKKAGIAQGHLHYYFASKDELLFELLDRIIDSFSEERKPFLQDPNKSCLEKLFVFLELKLDDIDEGGHDVILFDYWVQSASNEGIRKNMDRFYRPWRETIHEVIRAGVESGEFSAKYAEKMPSFLISIMDGAALQYLIDEETFDVHEYFRVAREMIAELLQK